FDSHNAQYPGALYGKGGTIIGATCLGCEYGLEIRTQQVSVIGGHYNANMINGIIYKGIDAETFPNNVHPRQGFARLIGVECAYNNKSGVASDRPNALHLEGCDLRGNGTQTANTYYGFEDISGSSYSGNQDLIIQDTQASNDISWSLTNGASFVPANPTS